VRVCPYNVFELRALAPEDKKGMSLRGRIKARVHGGRQAFVARPQDCHACAKCVAACPEGAIGLVT
jgi:NAD-dependent dihydropyrimidine dehydrogenase PreA subunit